MNYLSLLFIMFVIINCQEKLPLDKKLILQLQKLESNNNYKLPSLKSLTYDYFDWNKISFMLPKESIIFLYCNDDVWNHYYDFLLIENSMDKMMIVFFDEKDKIIKTIKIKYDYKLFKAMRKQWYKSEIMYSCE